ncbi:MAG: chorismate-binding protein [Blastomonas sp.]
MARSEHVPEALASLQAGQSTLIFRRRIADTETPVSAALKLFEPERGDFLLESVEGGETRARHSLLGIAPDLVFRAHGEAAEINRQWQWDRTAFASVAENSLNALRDLAGECRMDVPDALPKALACLVGYFGYETVGLVEKLPRAPESSLQLPDMLFVRPTVLLVFDRLKDELFLVAPLWSGSVQDAERQIERADEALDNAERLLDGTLPHPAPPQLPDLADIEAQPQMPPGRYHEMVAQAKSYIEAGDIFQVVLAQRFTAPFALPAIELYRALRRINPSPFLYFLDLPEFSLIGSSPEILVRVREGEITIRPIAGTRPRGRNPAEDAENRASLLADPKERAEHLMLLDLGRHDTGRYAEPGSVRVTDSFTVEQYSHVMHIVSNVTGRLQAGRDAIDAVFAGFPAGTVSGAPKVRACEIIAELEPETRGAYAGGVGYFAPDGSLDSCIVLRTAILKDGTMHVQSGAGIVADSQPDYEQRECEAKAGALFAAAREAVRQASEAGYGQ